MMEPLTSMDFDERRPFIAHAQLNIELPEAVIGGVALAKPVATLFAILDDLVPMTGKNMWSEITVIVMEIASYN
jgi:hypothetical protein